ncbi:unnamed protein product, partial [Iphiclides podalirius]
MRPWSRRRRANVRGVVRSLRGGPPFKDGRRARVSSVSRAFSFCASPAPSFRDVNLELPRLVYLLVVVSAASIAAVLPSVVTVGVVGLVRRTKFALVTCRTNEATDIESSTQTWKK